MKGPPAGLPNQVLVLLAIVGLSHKGYHEAYLSQMHDVRLVDAQKVLR